MRVVQSVLFDIKKFTPQQAVDKLLKMGYEFHKIDLKHDYWRFRQREPKKDAKYVTIDKGHGVKVIVMY